MIPGISIMIYMIVKTQISFNIYDSNAFNLYVLAYRYEKWHFSIFSSKNDISIQSVNTKSIACFPSSLVFVMIKS